MPRALRARVRRCRACGALQLLDHARTAGQAVRVPCPCGARSWEELEGAYLWAEAPPGAAPMRSADDDMSVDQEEGLPAGPFEVDQDG